MFGDVFLDIAGYVCKVTVAGIPYRSGEASDVLGIVGELDVISEVRGGEASNSPRPEDASRRWTLLLQWMMQAV